jgi:hypothetical protein
MSDRIDTGFGVVDLVPIHPGYFHWRQDRLHDEPRPEACAIVLDAAAAVEERAEQINRAQNQGVGQINGSRMKYERRRLSQPWRGLSADGRVSGQVEIDIAGCSGEHGSPSTLSGSVVVAILCTVSRTSSRAGAPAPHSFLDADA